MTLEDFFRKWFDKAADYSVRCQSLDKDGHPVIYIHPMDIDGDTLDFVVIGNSLVKLSELG